MSLTYYLQEEILKALIKLNVVLPGNKSVKELVDMRLGAVFMPHGLGRFQISVSN